MGNADDTDDADYPNLRRQTGAGRIAAGCNRTKPAPMSRSPTQSARFMAAGSVLLPWRGFAAPPVSLLLNVATHQETKFNL